MVTYRVITGGLRFRQAPGGPKVTVRRPSDAAGEHYTDSDAAPTLVTFEATAEVDIPSLLATGAIVPWEPAPAVSHGGVTDTWRPPKGDTDG